MARLYVDKLSAQTTGVAVSITDNTVVSGALTATSFVGDITGDVTGNASGTAGGLSGTPSITVASITGTASTLSGITKITNNTSSTSTSTGALVVTGGVGVGGDVWVGAGLSVAGTLTYEDVTNVDSVGLITAKSGINITGGSFTQTGGGEFKVGSALTVGSVGVATFIGAAGVAVTITPSTGKVEATTGAFGPITATTISGTQLTGTLQTAAQTNVTSVGTLAGLTVGSAGELKVGTALTMASTSGVATFSNEVWFNNPADGAKYARWRPSQDRFELQDDTTIAFGDAEDLQIYHNGSHSYLKSSTGNLYLTAKADEDGIIIRPDEGTELYHNNVKRIETTLEGVNVSGMVSATAGLGVTGGMWEGAFIKAGKLTDNKTLGISTSNIFVFTTQESTTGTPNIVWNDTYALSSKMKVGDSVTVTVITTAAAGGYCANWTIDGTAVTEQWNGGSAPSAGGDDGYDIYTLTLVRKATGTGDTGWLCFANVSNFT